MKRSTGLYILSFTGALFLFSGLLAQEKVEVSVTIKEDGKVVSDTTYRFEDVSEAKNALKMMHYSSALSGGEPSKGMVFVSKDGERTEIKEIHKDSLVWISEKEVDGDQMKVMKYMIEEGEEPHGEHVIVIRSEDGDTFDVMVDEDSEGVQVVKKKEVEVLVSEEEGEGEDVKVIVIKKKVK